VIKINKTEIDLQSEDLSVFNTMKQKVDKLEREMTLFAKRGKARVAQEEN
jgi:hypothetical protein